MAPYSRLSRSTSRARLVRVFSAALLAFVMLPHSAAWAGVDLETFTVARSNGTDVKLNGTMDTVTREFFLADFPVAATVADVNVIIEFAPVDGGTGIGACMAGPGMTPEHPASVGDGDAGADQIGYTLISPEGTEVVLIAPGDYAAGPTVGPAAPRTAIPAESYSVAFDDLASTPLGPDPATGVFIPNEPLSDFNGELATGIWTLKITDTATPDPLCHDRFRLQISAGEIPLPPTAEDIIVTSGAPGTTAKAATAKAGVTVAAGEVVEIEYSVTNNAATPALNARLLDTLPVGFEFIGANGADCTFGPPLLPNEMRCRLPGTEAPFWNLAPGQTSTFSAFFSVPDDFPQGLVFNDPLFRFDDGTAPPLTTVNGVQTPITVESIADLSVTKAALSTSVVEGSPTTYRVVVRNNGPSQARNIRLRDNVVAGTPGFTFNGSTSFPGPIPCAQNGSVITCVGGGGGFDIDPGRQTIFNITVTPDVGATVLSNTVDVGPNPAVPPEFTDPDFGNNTADSFTIVEDLATPPNLVLTSSVDGPVVAGEFITFEYTLTNTGETDAEAVVVNLSGPIVPFVPVGSSNPGCPGVGPCSPAFENGDVLPAGESLTFTATYLIDPASPRGEFFTFSEATHTTPPAGPVTTQGQDAGFVVIGVADLSITKFADADSANPGDPIVYTFVVRNAGPSIATYTLRDTIPQGYQPGSMIQIVGPNGCVETSPTQITCGFPVSPSAQIGPNQDHVYQIQILPDVTAAQADNIASVNVHDSLLVFVFPASDPFPGNNESTDTVFIEGAEAGTFVNLALSKRGTGQFTNPLTCAVTSEQDQVTAGNTISYVIQAANEGATDASNVVVEDYIPAGTFVENVTCRLNGVDTAGYPGTPGDINDPARCVYNVLQGDDVVPGGETGQMFVRLRVDPSYLEFGSDRLFNRATVVADQIDITPANNQAVSGDPTLPFDNGDVVTQTFDLLMGVAPLDPINAGETFRAQYVVFNAGPSTSEKPVLRIEVPAGVSFVDVPAVNDPTAVCDFYPATTALGLPDRVACELAPLPPGEQFNVVVEFFAGPDIPDGAALDLPASVQPRPGGGDCELNLNGPSANNFVGNPVVVVNQTTLSVDKTASTQSPIAGTTFEYTIEVTNTGAATATGVTLLDVLPADYELLSTTFANVSAFNPRSCSVNAVPNQLLCSFGNLQPGETVSLDAVVAVPADALVGTPVANTVTAQAINAPAVSAEQIVITDAVADLRITKVDYADPGLAGAQNSYALIVDNLGPSRADGVIVTDLLVVSDFIQANGCSLAVRTDGGALTNFDCNFALSSGVFELGTFGATHLNPRGYYDLAFCDDPGSPDDPSCYDDGRMIITINYTADGPVTLNNYADVTSLAFDPDTSNNSALISTDITAVADLGVTITDTLPAIMNKGIFGSVAAGTVAAWEIVVTNNGPSSAQNVELRNFIPAGLLAGTIEITGDVDNPVADDIADVGCAIGVPGDSQAPTRCDLGSMESGGIATLTMTGVVDPNYFLSNPPNSDIILRKGIFGPDGFLTNTVEVVSDTLDIDTDTGPGNPAGPGQPGADQPNFASSTIGIFEDANLVTYVIQGEPEIWTAGESYTMVFGVENLGPSAARDQSMLIELDEDVTFLRASGAIGDEIVPVVCIPTQANRLGCRLGDVPAPAGIPIVGSPRIYVDVMVNSDVPSGSFLEFLALSVNSSDILGPFDFEGCNDGIVIAGPGAVQGVCLEVETDIEATVILEKNGVTPTAIAGELFTYEFTLTNEGPSDITNVRIRDELPEGVSFVESDGNCEVLSTDPDDIRCRPAGFLGTAPNYRLAAGESVSFSVVVEIDPDVIGELVNEAEVRFAQDDDPNVTIFEVPDQTVVVGSADLRLTVLSDAENGVAAGEDFTTTIIVDNLGVSAAYGVLVRNSLLTNQAVEVLDCNVFSIFTDGGPASSNNCMSVFTVPSAPSGYIDLTAYGVDPLNPRGSLIDGCVDPLDPSCVDQGRVVIEIRATATEAVDLDDVTDVTAQTSDPDLSNNFAATRLNVNAIADLGITKVADDPVIAGEFVSWTIEVENFGPSGAENVIVQDYLPAGLVDGTQVITGTVFNESAGAEIDPISCDGGQVGSELFPATCDLGSMPVGWTAEITVTALVDPNYFINRPGLGSQAMLINSAVVSSSTPDIAFVECGDPDQGLMCPGGVDQPNFANAPTEVGQERNLVVGLAASEPLPWVAGEERTWLFIVSNNGPSSAVAVDLTGELSAGQTFLRAWLGDPASGGRPIPCAFTSGNDFFCSLGTITPTDRQKIVFVDVLIDPGLEDEKLLLAEASAISATPGSANTAFGSLEVVTKVALELLVTSDPVLPLAGSTFTINYKVTNDGPSNAFDVSVTDLLPEGLTFVAAPDFCAVTAVLLDCDLVNDLGVGESFDFNVQVAAAPDAIGPQTLNSDVTAGNGMVMTTVITSGVTIIGSADLMITKIRPDTVPAGEPFDYSLIVENLGDSAAENVVIRDRVVAGGGAVLESCTLTVTTDEDGVQSFDCSAAALIGEWRLDDFDTTWLLPRSPESDGRVVIEMVLIVDDPDFLSNTSSVTASTFDPDESNNQVLDSVVVDAVADLSITKSAVGEVLEDDFEPIPLNTLSLPPFPQEPQYFAEVDRVAPGRRLRYTIEVENQGPSSAPNVEMSDVVPTGLQVLAGTLSSSQGSCTIGTAGDPSDPLTCSIGELAVGATATVVFDVVVDSDFEHGDIIDNDADVWSDAFDPSNGDNRANNQSIVQVTTADFFTQLFLEGEQDLHQSLTFTPNKSRSFYGVCRDGSGADPSDRAEDTLLDLGDDDFAEVPVSRPVLFYGEKYNSVFVGSNGYVTFVEGDDEHIFSLEHHFSAPRISVLFTDLNPELGGEVFYVELADRLIITWRGIKMFNSEKVNRVSLELFFDGQVRMRWEGLDQWLDSVVGLSEGNGMPDPFFETDLNSEGIPVCRYPVLFENGFERRQFLGFWPKLQMPKN